MTAHSAIDAASTRGRVWGDDEDRLILDGLPDAEVMARTGRSLRAVQQRRSILAAAQAGAGAQVLRLPPWTAAEDDLIRQGLPDAEVMARTGRSNRAVEQRRVKLMRADGIARPAPARHAWTAARDAQLRSLAHLPRAEIAAQMGLTEKAVRGRLSILRQGGDACGMTFWTVGEVAALRETWSGAESLDAVIAAIAATRDDGYRRNAAAVRRKAVSLRLGPPPRVSDAACVGVPRRRGVARVGDWTDAEDALLRAEYASGLALDDLAAQLAALNPGVGVRSETAIVQRARAMGLRRAKGWSLREVAVLREGWVAGVPVESLIGRLAHVNPGGFRRSPKSVVRQAQVLGLKRPAGFEAAAAKAAQVARAAARAAAVQAAPRVVSRPAAAAAPAASAVIAHRDTGLRLQRGLTAQQVQRVLTAHLDMLGGDPAEDLALAQAGFAGQVPGGAARVPFLARWRALVCVFEGLAQRGLPVEAAALLLPVLRARAAQAVSA